MTTLSIGIILLALGAVIGFGGFIYWVKNMGSTTADMLNPGGFGKAAMKMIPFALGGLLFLAGVITIIIHYAEKVTS